MILVTGATGTVGSQIVAELTRGGQPVRVLTRSREKANIFGPTVDVVIGNLDEPASLIPAMKDVERFFLLTSKTQQDTNALEIARSAGVKHVVKLSTQEAGWTPVEGHGHWHKEREELIKNSGLTWTFLRPCMFMNFMYACAGTIRAEGVIYTAGGEGKLSPIDPRDVSAVAAAALTKPGHENVGYELTGPEILNFNDMAEILTRVLGRTIRHVGISDEAQGAVFAKMGLPKYSVDGLVETFTLIRKGRFAHMTSDVEKATGVKPRSFETWARDNARAFRV